MKHDQHGGLGDGVNLGFGFVRLCDDLDKIETLLYTTNHDMDGWGFAFLPCPPSPEQPPGPLLPTGGLHVSEPRPLPLLPPPSPRPPEPHAQPHGHESNHQQRLQGLCKHGPGQQEQAHAAEDDGRGDPRLVGAVEVRFAHAQHDEAEDGQEVEGVAGDAVEGDERVEGAGELGMFLYCC